MRTLPVLAAILFLAHVPLCAQNELDVPEEVDWLPSVQRIAPPPVDGTTNLHHTFGLLRSVSDDDSVLTACSTGPGYPVILRSTDFGTTWSVVYDPGYRGQPDMPRDAVSFRNGFVCYVFSQGRVLISRDAGMTWSDRRLDTLANIQAVDFLDDRNGMIRWGPRGVDALLTSDGGMTWDSLRVEGVYVNRSSAIVDVAMIGHDQLTIVRNYLDTSWAYVTTDRGATWNMARLPSPVQWIQRMGGTRLWGFCHNFINPGAIGDFRAYDEAWESPDAGITWTRLIKSNTTASPWGVREVIGIDPNLLIVGGSASKLYYVDRGRWKIQKSAAFGLPEAAIRNLHRHDETAIFGTIGPDFFRMTYVPSPASGVDTGATISMPIVSCYVTSGDRLGLGLSAADDARIHAVALDGSDASRLFSIVGNDGSALLVGHAMPPGIYAVSIQGRNVSRRLLLNVR